jgi:glycosyltransferase involved in cell wall biosynthesis
MPFFSIVLPTNKSLAKIEQSLSSCLLSRFGDFEIIIGVQDFQVWDGDNSRIKSLLVDSRVRIVDATAASNLPANLNIILDSIHSPYAVRHDDDDLMHPLRLQRLYEQSELLKRAVVIGQAYKVVNKSFAHISGLILPSREDVVNRERLLVGPCFAHSAITLNMAKLQRRYDEDFTYAQDYKLYVDNFYAGQFVGLESMATYYNAPDVNGVGYKSKRIRQLGFHDHCMFRLWDGIVGGGIVKIDMVAKFRKSFITSEDDETLCRNLLLANVERDKLSRMYMLVSRSLKSQPQV